MNVVVDTSALLAVLLEEDTRQRVVALTVGCELIAPEVLPYELGNALIALLRRRIHDEEQTTAVWRLFCEMPLGLRSIDIGAALKIAARQGIYAYDAYLIQCCIETRSPLLSLDRRLNAATEREGAGVRREG